MSAAGFLDRVQRRFFIEIAVLYLLSLTGTMIQRMSRSAFDYWELTFALLVPMACLVVGKVIYDHRVTRFGLTTKSARHYGLFFGMAVFLTAAFQTISTVLFSPGGPDELRGHVWSICGVYAVVVAVVDYRANRILMSCKDSA